MNVSIFITCLGDSYFPRASIAAVKVLERLGCRVDFPAAQTCCGQPMFNNGFHDDARVLARRMIGVFEHSERVVTVSGSCASMIREYYPGLFAGDEEMRGRAARLAGKTFEFGEFLVRELNVDLAALGARSRGRTTYHYSCHLRGLGVTDEAVRLIGQIGGVEFAPLGGAEQCCGFGGTFATKYPAISGKMARDKAEAIRATCAARIVSSEPGCTMNLAGACRRYGIETEFTSLAELIAESLGLMEGGGARG
ncbi:MAG TPA: (Fe-S)-binding protein [Phycisphaerales bacterium]|nr:(Fe-S)-binding protein [Phycisphaerales bacterium]